MQNALRLRLLPPDDQGQSALHEVSMYLSSSPGGVTFVGIAYAVGLGMQQIEQTN